MCAGGIYKAQVLQMLLPGDFNQSQRKREREASVNAHEPQELGFTTEVLWPASLRSRPLKMSCFHSDLIDRALVVVLRAQVQAECCSESSHLSILIVRAATERVSFYW